MKQRILSFVLAVIMVVLAVPAVLLPTVAAEARPSLTTKMEVGGENWPTAQTTDGKAYQPVYHNGWSMGKMDAGVYTEFDLMTMSNGKPQYLQHALTGQWNDAGIFLYMDGRAAILGAIKESEGTNFPEYNEAGELLWNGLIDGTGPGPYYKVVDSKSGRYRNTSAFVYTYTSPYEGVVDLSIADLVLSQMTGTGSNGGPNEPDVKQVEYWKAYFSIYVNGVMVWPTAGGDATNPEHWAIYPKMENGEKVTEIVDEDLLCNIKVGVGDVIQFATARYNCRLVKCTPTVTYHEGYNLSPTSLTEDFGGSDVNWPAIRKTNGISSLKQTDISWTLGEFDVTANTFTPFLRQRKDKTETWACDTGNNPSKTDDNGILLGSAYKEQIGALMVGAKETNLRPAYLYSALATGVADIGLGDGFMLINKNAEAAKNASGKITVYKNGQSLGVITITTDASGVATATGAFTDVSVTRKDKIAFVATEVADGAIQILANPVVQYKSISSFIDAATTDKYVLAMDAASIIVGDKIAMSFSAYGTRDVYEDATEVKLRVWDNTVVGEKTAANAVAELDMTVQIYTDYAYTCVYDEFAPKQMTETVTVQAYTVIDGQEYASATQEVSLAAVAYEQYEKAVAVEDEGQINLMVAVLNYGAAAQEYFNYKTDDLANKNLPEELKVIDKKEDGYYSAAIMDSKDPEMSNYAYSEITSVSLVLESTIGIRVYVDVAPDEADKPITMRTALNENDLAGKGEEVDGAYAFTLDGIGLTQLKTTYYFQAVVTYTRKVGNKEIPSYYGANIFTYSVEAYVARMAYEADKPELSNLLHALMNLSDAASAVS